MSDSTYTLEWRGAKRSGFSYADIEAGLSAGDLHSLYKINVDGRWIVLRDFVEQQRAMTMALNAASQQAASQVHAHQPAPQPETWPSLAAPSMHPPASPPPPWGGMSPAPALHSAKVPKPVWFWPTVILSSTVCLLLVVVVVYVSATSRSSSQRIAESKVEENQETKAETKPTDKHEDKPEDKPRQAKFQPYSFTGKEIFPSAVISTARVDWNGDEQSAEDKKTDADALIRKREVPIYGDENSWLGVKLSGLHKGAQVKVDINSDGLMKSARWHGTVTTLGEDGVAMIRPKVIWDYEALRKAIQQRPINVTFSTSIDDTPLPEATEIYTLRSINDCPLYVSRDKSGKNSTSLSFLFAAYVNENHPMVQDILKEAQECHIVDKFDGYLSENPKEVYLQVFSIWNALQRRGIKYSNIAATTPGDTVVSQSIRFLDQSINHHQANCVDGSVLMASVLQKIGIKSYLVIIPHHCFLAFDLTPDSTALPIGLETTMLGHNEITEIKNLGYLPKQEKFKEYEDSYKTFGEAVEVGTLTIQANARTLQSHSDVLFRLVSIEEERNFGINPISFEKDK